MTSHWTRLTRYAVRHSYGAASAVMLMALQLVATGLLRSQQPRDTIAECQGPLIAADSAGTLASAIAMISTGIACHDVRLLDGALDRMAPVLLRGDASAALWYQAGRARYGLAALGAMALTRDQRLIGMSYAQRAAVALREALKRDPNHAAAAALLASERLRTLAHITSDNDAAAIRRAAPLNSSDAAALLARARVELNWERPDSAAAAATRVLEIGGDSALALLERARAQFMEGRLAAGEASWLNGLASARSDAAQGEYRQDFAWVATDAELAQFDSLPRAAKEAWARVFWDRRAEADFRTTGARLAEHERRVRYALAEFSLRVGERNFNKAMPYRSEQVLVDDRGVIYIRHGAPSRIIKSVGRDVAQQCPVYSWLYEDGADRGMTVNFRPFFTIMISDRVVCANTDFKLVPGGIWAMANAAKLADHDSLYARWLNERRPLHRARLGRAVVAKELDNLALAAMTDAYPVHFERSLGAVVRTYGLAHPGRLLVAFGVPPASLTRIALSGRPAYPVRLRLTALPGGGGPPVTLDTTLVYDASRTLAPGQWIAGSVDLPVPADDYEIRWLLTGADPAAGSSGLQVGVDVPGAQPGRPTVSALLLGTTATELRWPSAAGPFPISASNTYRVGAEVEILLEAADLPPDAAARVVFRIEPVEGAKGKRVEVAYDGHATGTALVLRQTLSLQALTPGYYRLTVEVRAGSGRPVSRSQPLWVVK